LQKATLFVRVGYMGGLPKQRHTKSSVHQRRMHIFIKQPSFSKCPKCGKPVLSHTVCFNCGLYKGVQVIDVLKKLTKKERKAKEKEIAVKDQASVYRSEGGKEGGAEKKPLNWEELSKK